MHEFTIKQASLSCRWICNRILPALPFPSSQWSGLLLTRLSQYGVGTQDVAVEAPGNRLSDVALVITLLGGQLTLRVTYGGFEIQAGRLLDEHIRKLPGLAEIVLSTLTAIDAEASQGKIGVSYAAHLGLETQAASRVLAKYLQGGRHIPGFRPDAFAYEVRAESRPDILTMRIAVATSLFFEEALFINLTAEYSLNPASAETAEAIRRDCFEVLSRLDLRPSTETGG